MSGARAGESRERLDRPASQPAPDRATGIGKSWLGEGFAERASIPMARQVPVKGSHDLIGEPTHTDAFCDRLIHTAYAIELQGSSLPETRACGQ